MPDVRQVKAPTSGNVIESASNRIRVEALAAST
jgi:hypothetical protein